MTKNTSYIATYVVGYYAMVHDVSENNLSRSMQCTCTYVRTYVASLNHLNIDRIVMQYTASSK